VSTLKIWPSLYSNQATVCWSMPWRTGFVVGAVERADVGEREIGRVEERQDPGRVDRVDPLAARGALGADVRLDRDGRRLWRLERLAEGWVTVKSSVPLRRCGAVLSSAAKVTLIGALSSGARLKPVGWSDGSENSGSVLAASAMSVIVARRGALVGERHRVGQRGVERDVAEVERVGHDLQVAAQDDLRLERDAVRAAGLGRGDVQRAGAQVRLGVVLAQNVTEKSASSSGRS